MLTLGRIGLLLMGCFVAFQAYLCIEYFAGSAVCEWLAIQFMDCYTMAMEANDEAAMSVYLVIGMRLLFYSDASYTVEGTRQ